MPGLQHVRISTERLGLRTFTEGDAAEMFAGITPGLTRFMNWEPSASPEHFVEVWRSWLPLQHEGTDLQLTIRAGDEFVGMVGLHGLRDTEPELGIWLKEDAQGLGYGYEAAAAVIAWASQRFDISAFQWPVAVDNTPSRRIAEKLGGVVAGTFSRPKYAAVLYRVPARG
ncbi:MAG: GNAT family N-acetyltransferase [Devosia sp.]